MPVRERRLPGIRFETRSPALPEALPRMDIACFVGFAASGPLHVPVPVEDAAAFADLFGDAPALAWDDRRGEPLRAQLAPAVRAFFRCGGRRCWVVRVAGPQAAANTFPIPGLITVTAGDDGRPLPVPARLRARSEGSWSDGLQVAAALLEDAVRVEQADFVAGTLRLRPGRVPIGAGDLLRLRAGGALAFVEIGSAEADPAHTGGEGAPLLHAAGVANQTLLTARAVHWFRAAAAPSLPEIPGATWWVRGAGDETELDVLPEAIEPDGDALRFTVAGDLDEAPPPGALLRVQTTAGELWLIVREVAAVETDSSPLAGSPPGAALRIRAAGLLRLDDAPLTSVENPPAHRLTMELRVRAAGAGQRRLRDLAFGREHPRWWDALPTDHDLFAAPDLAAPEIPAPEAARDATARALLAERSAPLWAECAAPRWPLAGARDVSRMALPLALEMVWAGADAPAAATPLERDGLDDYSAALFLDRDLVEPGALTLLDSADFLRYQSPAPRALTGVHAALAIEEITLIAAPDAAHTGWRYRTVEPPEPPDPSPPPPRPEWFGGNPCAAQEPPDSTAPPLFEPLRDRFLECGLEVVDAPQFTPPQSRAQVSATGTYRLEWTEVAGAVYELEQASLPTFADATIVQSGSATEFAVFGRGAGDCYYRVRARRGGQAGRDAVSNWSLPAVVRVAAQAGWHALSPADYAPDTLLAVQRALLRLCAARADLCAVLALPDFFREDEAIAHVALLKSAAAEAIPIAYEIAAGARTATSLPLGYGEARAFSFGVLYHPWLQMRQAGQDGDSAVRPVTPEGAACGLLARRALERGAWVAPANDALPDVVALTPAPARARLLDLQGAQINVLRQEPRGFLTLSADTLSDDATLRPLNVRRLLILLRRLALRLGARYVFEPNSDAFRRLVQRGFEALLDDLYVRGAFAGPTPESAYQVVAGPSLNTPQSVDAGRFIVELRVAPSLPMRFLTVRLVQAHDRSLSVE